MMIEHLLMFQAMLHKTSYTLALLSFAPEGIKFIFRGIVVGSSRGLSCIVQAARIGLLRYSLRICAIEAHSIMYKMP